MKLPYIPSVTLVLMTLSGAIVSAADAQTRGETDFQKRVLPVLNEYCWDCHADGMDKGNVELDKFKTYSDSLRDRKFWDAVREHVSTHVMPPDGKPQPSEPQRETILQWIDDAVMWVDPSKPDPGHSTLRRLNRSQYNNTVRDVFFVDTKPANQFPPDDTGYGYDNIGDVLSLSPMLMEKYIRAAKKVTEESAWIKQPLRTEFTMIHEEFNILSGQGRNDDGPAAALYTNGEMAAQFHVEKYANWRLMLDLGADQCGSEKARYAVLIDGNKYAEGEIINPFDRDHPDQGGWQRVTVEARLGSGKHKLAIRFLNDAADPQNPDPKKRDRNLLLHQAVVVGPIGFEAPSRSKFIDWVLDGKKTALPALRLNGEDFDAEPAAAINWSGSACLFCNGSMYRTIDVPKAGEYTFHVYATEDHAGNEGALMRVTVDGQDWGRLEVTGAPDISRKLNLKAGPHKMEIAFLNDFNDGKHDRNLFVNNVLVESPPEPVVDPRSAEFTRDWITRLGVKSFRRPLTDGELERLTKMAKLAFDSGDDLAGAVRLVSEAILCSSNFLFCGGARPEGPVDKNTVLIDEFSLASRLSYFLWSSCPDEQLLQLAQNGELRKNLAEQVRRMISDWKAFAFTENFAGQWLQLRDMTLVAPETKRFPDFSGKIAYDMMRESQLYFENILKNNRSVLEFLDSDYTFVNNRLAKYYGLPSFKAKSNDDFQQVSLSGTPRGGILTQGSILTLTSHPTRTSPVKRGKFLLENILGTPPPPPPQNVPAFKEDRGSRVKGTLRQRFEAHRANPTCASCHAFLDPMGFAFEHFDAIGRWRDQDNGANIDATGQLLSGQKFDGAAELRKLLVENRKKEFTLCLAENLLVYGLGRGLDYSDKLFKDDVARRAAQNDYHFQDMIMGVVESVPFQRMRAEDAKNVASMATDPAKH